jgi:hypothetical protein
MSSYNDKRTFLSRSLSRWFLLLLFLVVAVLVRSMVVLPHEQKKFDRRNQQYLEKHNARKEGAEARFSKQERFQVKKHLWLSKKKPRLEIELKAAKSEIGMTLVKADMRLIETFHDAEGMIQEELFYKDQMGQEYVILETGQVVRKQTDGKNEPVSIETLIPMQRFRYFEADQAIYDYHANTLVASNVHFWTYTAKGHELVKTRRNLWPESSGKAATMTLCHLGSVDSLQFSAENLNVEVEQKW